MEDQLKLLKERRSVRKFRDEEVPKKDVKKILEAGRWAPSSHNSQPWNFLVFRNKKKEVGETGKWSGPMKEADFGIAIVVDEETENNAINTGIAGQNMVLEAWDLGIGSCWIRSFNEKKVKDMLSIPEEKKVETLLAFGYPDEQPNSSRKNLDEMVHWDDW